MISGTQCQLSDQTIAQLQRLIQLNLDAEADFHDAATRIANEPTAESHIVASLTDIFAVCGQHATILQDYVELSGKVPRTDGTYLAAVKRVCRELRSTIASDCEAAILRGSKEILREIETAYASAICEVDRADMRDKLAEQCAELAACQLRLQSLATNCE